MIGATALSSALALILPILAVGAVVVGTSHARRHLALMAALVVPQAYVVVTAVRRVSNEDVTLARVVTAFQDLVVSQGWFGGQGPIPDVIVPIALVGSAVALVILARLPRRAGSDVPSHRPGAETAVRSASDAGLARRLLALAGLVSVGTAIFAASVYLNRTVNPRYGYAPAAMISIGLVLACGWVALEGRRRTLRFGLGTDPESGGPTGSKAASPERDRLVSLTTVSTLVVVLAIAIVYGSSFRLRSRASSGPDVVAAIHRAGRQCAAATERVTVPVSPRVQPLIWTIEIPCDRFGD
jgi:hypothetical protein